MRLPLLLGISSTTALAIGYMAGSYFSILPAASTTTGTHAASHSGSSNLAGLGASVATNIQAGVEESKSNPLTAPASDLNSILKESNPYRMMKDLSAYLDTVKAEDMAHIMKQLESMPQSMAKLQATSMLMGRWADLDPKGAMAAALDGKNRFSNLMNISSVFAAVAASNPQEAINQIQQITDPRQRSAALQAAIGQLALQDPQKALQLLQSSGDTNAGGGRMGGMFGARGGLYGTLFCQLASKDIGQATQMALQLPAGNDRSNAFQGIASQWAQKDPQAAIAWMVGQLPAGADRDSAQRTIVDNWAATDPKAAILYAQSQTGDTAANLVRNVAAQWLNSDSAAAVSWLKTLPDGATKTQVINALSNQWARSDPQTAAAYALTLTGEAQATLANAVAGRWASSDPAAAAKWIASLPAGTQNNGVYTTMATEWARKDSYQASTWLQQLPTGSNRDSAILGFTNQVVRSDPEGALLWSVTIGDTQTRLDQTQKIYQRWSKTDPTAAATAIQNSSLSDAEKQSLLQQKH
ncbi:MAG: hypothetical protein PHD76_12455 [Methylacidiphilales bacterium]|nr:hypothetical protein [Candidatus Methylacidiphilales bacterium]